MINALFNFITHQSSIIIHYLRLFQIGYLLFVPVQKLLTLFC